MCAVYEVGMHRHNHMQLRIHMLKQDYSHDAHIEAHESVVCVSLSRALFEVSLVSPPKVNSGVMKV